MQIPSPLRSTAVRTAPQAQSRRASLFRNGRNQAVRIPREFELAGREVMVHKQGDSLVLTPVEQGSLAQLLASWEPLNEDFPEVQDLPVQERRWP